MLDSSQDAVTQITNTLLGRSNVASLQIVSHGEAGGLNFGSNVLNLTDLPQYAAQIQSWSQALTNDADILLYGCNTAQSELGEAFVSILSQLTGADVAASNDLTGNSALGGNWNLEVSTGEIESSFALQKMALESYKNVLAAIVDTKQTWDATGDNTDIRNFGEDGSGTYGQVFTVPTGETTVTAFTFYLNDFSDVPINFAGYIEAWDGTKAVGENLYASTQRATTGKAGFEPFTFTGSTNVVAGAKYVAFLSVIGYTDGLSPDRGAMAGGLPASTYPGGDFVSSNSTTFAALTTAAWDTSRNVDAAFNLQFGVFSNPPIVTVSGSPLAYTENSPATLIDSAATVTDGDSPNLNTGTLTANFSANGTADDRLTIVNQGVAADQIGVSGTTVTYGGTAIGTFTGGIDTTPLVVTFNSASTPAAAQALLQNLAYSNVSDAPSTTNRTVSFVVSDGANGISTAANKTITVTAVNDAAIWQMNGFAAKSTFLITAVADTNWQVAGTADLNGDGIADLVWRNRATGENALWQMSSTGLQSGTLITAVPDLNWQIAGVADLGGSSTPDFLWRNAATTQVAIWQLSSFTALSKRISSLTYPVSGATDRSRSCNANTSWLTGLLSAVSRSAI